MAEFIAFPTATADVAVLVETDAVEVGPAPSGVEKAGILRRADASGGGVAVAKVRFDLAMQQVIAENVRALGEAIRRQPVKPAEVELRFGLKATGEVGNIAIAKVGGEATFEVRMLWRPSTADAAEA